MSEKGTKASDTTARRKKRNRIEAIVTTEYKSKKRKRERECVPMYLLLIRAEAWCLQNFSRAQKPLSLPPLYSVALQKKTLNNV